MIIEGLLTSTDVNGSAHIAPMGPVVDDELSSWTLRPFQTSNTFRCLRNNHNCIFHVVDDVLLLVQLIVGEDVQLQFSQNEYGWVLDSACHWYALNIHEWDVSEQRSEAKATVVHSETIRPVWGWNRAKHAVIEATILATRLHLLTREYVEGEFERLKSAVDKTAGDRELQAWELLNVYVRNHQVEGTSQ